MIDVQFDDPKYYINRELSWLAFNERVLDEARDAANPLLERLKFIGITSSNLDEFFIVRVAGLKKQEVAGSRERDTKAGLTASEQLTAISERAHCLIEQLDAVLHGDLLPELKSEGISFLTPKEMDAEQLAFIEAYYQIQIRSRLKLTIVDSHRSFEMLRNGSVSLAALWQDAGHAEPQVGIVHISSTLPRSIQLPSASEHRQFVLLENIIMYCGNTLFQEGELQEIMPFRVTRSVDLVLDVENSEDLMRVMQQQLEQKKLGTPVRLEVTRKMSGTLRDKLRTLLGLGSMDVYNTEGPLDLSFYIELAGLPGYDDLRHAELIPQDPVWLKRDPSIFATIAREDLLVHHPYESFDPVLRFIWEAAEDQDVLAIKQTLYRVSGDSPIVHALEKAAYNGKKVTVLVELKARFDEENNVGWAKALEQAGCKVIYGLPDLKVHSKITLVVRREGKETRRYVHLGTGNYNDATAKLYTDLGMFTGREEFGEDAESLFDHLCGEVDLPPWQRVVTAPHGMRRKIIDLIKNEIKHVKMGYPSRIIAKMNSLTDKEIIKALYKASCAGVRIDLIIRGICCLRPGIPGVSEHISVISIVGRFLEHSRIYYFRNGGDERIYLASADWMTRNMQRRIEIMFPLLQDNLKQRIKIILAIMWADSVKARALHSDGTYTKVESADEGAFESQLYFYNE